MPTYQSFADQVQRLDRAIRALAPRAAALGIPPPDGEEWFDLLQNKLLAEIDLPPLLVVAIVGGTNIGKSVIFNHLAGEVASAASPLAAGTKHPVCLAPEELAERSLLERLFVRFDLCDWRSADDPLGESPEDMMFWREGKAVPPRLLLLDAPDVDSDAEVNWRRAKAIRQTADVLVAVLTQQKYNDAAVKRFFRAAVEADKPIVVIFNQCDMASDAEYWPRWLATFRENTGARPELVYAVPYDRRAADELRLPFHAISAGSELPEGLAADGTSANSASSGPTCRRPLNLDQSRHSSDLRDDLAALRFDEIKIRTFRGAIRRILDPQSGLPAYLDSIRIAADDFSHAAAALATTEMSPGHRCRPAFWSMKSATGGTTRVNPGRAGCMYFIVFWAEERSGRCEPLGTRWPGRTRIRRSPSRDTSAIPSSWPWKNCSTSWTGWPRLAMKSFAQDY